jgi:hypothetical protein
MSTITPNFTDTGTAAIAIATLALHANTSAVIDLRTKRGAWFFASVGRGGTTAHTAGMGLLIRRTGNAGVIEHPSAPMFVGDSATATRVTCTAAGTPNNAGVTSITTATNTGIVAGDLLFIDDTGNVGIGNSEWARAAFVTSSTVILLDRPTQYAHNSTNAHLSNHADVFSPVWMDGGCEVEVIFDYGASSTGDTDVVRCFYSTYDSDTVA